MTEQRTPEPEERDASLERRTDEQQMQGPEHGDPEDQRERAGLDDENAGGPPGPGGDSAP